MTVMYKPAIDTTGQLFEWSLEMKQLLLLLAKLLMSTWHIIQDLPSQPILLLPLPRQINDCCFHMNTFSGFNV